VEVKFKKLDEKAVMPKKAHSTDAGMDMVAISRTETDQYVSYDTGIAMAIPEGYMGLLFPRSSISKKDLVLANSVGILDSSYRGSISFRFKTLNENSDSLVRLAYEKGDRIGQLVIMPFPDIELVEAKELDETERNGGGYGSTGN